MRVGGGCEGLSKLNRLGQRGHHTEHLSTGFIGELFGQWKTRANSSNWETLPITLQGMKRSNVETGTFVHLYVYKVFLRHFIESYYLK